jgi:hypothetical protein
VGCKTIELDVKLRKLVGKLVGKLVEKLVGRKKVETVVMDDKSRKGVLFVRLVPHFQFPLHIFHLYLHHLPETICILHFHSLKIESLDYWTFEPFFLVI